MPGWKDRYYDAKFPGVDDAGRREVAAAYVEGLQWVMRYYYDGCASWKWFYPYHYAPFAADLAAAIDPGQPADFELARPFRPFEQLMGVLPPRSAHALPEPLAQLMTDPGSEIADFYPEDFALDLNGKKFLWQAVVLLPFIDEARDHPRSPEITRDYPRLPFIDEARRADAMRDSLVEMLLTRPLSSSSRRGSSTPWESACASSPGTSAAATRSAGTPRLLANEPLLPNLSSPLAR